MVSNENNNVSSNLLSFFITLRVVFFPESFLFLHKEIGKKTLRFYPKDEFSKKG